MDRIQQDDASLDQIEYLLQQSALGFHFIFEKSEIVRVLSRATDDKDFFSTDNMTKVQDMLTRLIERPTMVEKNCYLERLSPEEYDLLLRAYFHLVENTVLANSKLKH